MNKALSVLTILILSLAITSTVRAQTPTPTLTIYTAQDPEDQDQGISGIENYVFWLPFQVDTVYYRISDNGDASFITDVEDALNAWSNAFPPGTNWYWAPAGSLPFQDVHFRNEACPYAPSATGCIVYTGWQQDSDWNANFIKEVQIWVNPNYSWSAGARRGTLAHELGHLFGLDERYRSGCNPDDYTIMDNAVITNNVVSQCDTNDPTSIDSQRVTRYWGEEGVSGGPVDINLAPYGPELYHGWQDDGWAEYWHRMRLYYWDNASGQWIEETNWYALYETGVHRETQSRVIGPGYYTPQHPNHWYDLCGYGIYYFTYANAAWRCSDVIFVE